MTTAVLNWRRKTQKIATVSFHFSVFGFSSFTLFIWISHKISYIIIDTLLQQRRATIHEPFIHTIQPKANVIHDS